MRKRPNYEQMVLALTALFVLCAGVLLAIRMPSGREWRVQTEREDGEVSSVSGENGWPDSLLPGEILDLNTASAGDLERLPGIGSGRAEDIVAYRQEHGAFRSVDELTAIKGIGKAMVDRLRLYVTVENPVGHGG